MKKKFFVLLLVFAMTMAALTVTVTATSQEGLPAQCEHCQKQVEWTKLENADVRNGIPTATGHYYLDLDKSQESYDWMTQTKIPSGSTVCLYLNGQSLRGTTATFIVQNGAVFNIMDDSGEGVIMGRGRSDGAVKGIALSVEKGGEANLYGGTLTREIYNSTRHASDGGIAYVAGTFNMYGGKIEGGTAGKENTTGASGGNVFVANGGVFTMYDGRISNGTAVKKDSVGGNGGNVNVADGGSFIMKNGVISGGTAGNGGGSVYVSPTAKFEMHNGSISGGSAAILGNCVLVRGSVLLAGNASVDELQLKTRTDMGGPVLSNMLTIKGVYTGTVKLLLDTVVEGLDLGNAVDAVITDAQISIYGSFLTVEVVNNQLVTAGAKAYCEHCDEQVSWIALTEGDAELAEMESGHYYLAFEADSYTFVEKNIYVNQMICLNLNGKKLNGATRAFSIFDGGILNIMGDGTVAGQGGTNSKFNGGTINVGKGGTLNLYSGTIAFNDVADDSYAVVNGGTLSVDGVFNMYNGQVLGGVSTNAAGTIFGESTSQLNFYGGTVQNGKSPAAPCIYNKGKVTLAGNASVAQILLKNLTVNGKATLPDMLTISGDYTGKTVLFGCSLGSDIGTDDRADLTGAQITISGNSTASIATVGGDLIVLNPGVAASLSDSGAWTTYSTVQAAVNACSGRKAKVVLLSDVDALAVTDDLVLDLNGYDIDSVVVESGKILYAMDSVTDDYDISDGNYGKIKKYSGTISAVEATERADSYLLVEESDGISFHRLTLRIDAVALRPSCTGLYYVCEFNGDSLVRDNAESFGVALNVFGEPTLENLETTSGYTSISADKIGTGSENTSSLLKNILKTDLTNNENLERSETRIYGRPYIKLGEDQYIFGNTQISNLSQIVSSVNEQWSGLNAVQKNGVYQMYDAFENLMSQWSVSEIKAARELKAKYDAVEKTPTQADVDSLNALYAGTTPYYGELHDHSSSGPKGDGKQTLTVWKRYMDAIGMDFATIVDHKQSAHMYLDEWDTTKFVGGSEFATWITDYTHTADAEGNLHNGVHHNMIFADREVFLEYLKSVPEYRYSGNNVLTDMVPGYPSFSRARMVELVNTILDMGGFFTHVHPKSPSYLISDNPLDYWFADWTGIEVILSRRSNAVNADNYKLWTDLLALGKKVYATAGSDNHNMPNIETMSTFYTTEKSAQAFLDNMRAGNFTAGMAGIRMSIDGIVMGSQATENFAGKRLVFAVGDFHRSLVENGHDYRVDLYNDEGIIFSQDISSDETTYFAIDAQDCKFYRVEVYDTTDNVLISMGQPIWNVGA